MAWACRPGRGARRSTDVDALVAFCQRWADRRDTLDLEIDGVVVKVDRLDYQDVLGQVSTSPRWATAFKFPAREATTRLEGIDHNVGRTGVIKPLARLAPVEVGGVTVSKATLHNADYITSRDIRVGDDVVIKRAGDVIPAVVGPVTADPDRDRPVYQPPTECPVCGRALVRPEGEVDLRHRDGGCPAQLKRAVEHWAARSALDVDGLGTKIAALLVEHEMVADLPDLYRLDRDALLALDGFKDRKVDNLLAGLAASKTRPLARLLFGLGIRHVGATVARDLVAHHESLDALAAADGESLEAIDGVGPIVAESVVAWFDDETNQATVQGLRAAGLNMARLATERVAAVIDDAAPLVGVTVVLTGTLPTMTRPQAKARIEQAGGEGDRERVEKDRAGRRGRVGGLEAGEGRRARRPLGRRGRAARDPGRRRPRCPAPSPTPPGLKRCRRRSPTSQEPTRRRRRPPTNAALAANPRRCPPRRRRRPAPDASPTREDQGDLFGS